MKQGNRPSKAVPPPKPIQALRRKGMHRAWLPVRHEIATKFRGDFFVEKPPPHSFMFSAFGSALRPRLVSHAGELCDATH